MEYIEAGLFVAGSFLSIVLSYAAWLFGRFLWSFMNDEEFITTKFDDRVSVFLSEWGPSKFSDYESDDWWCFCIVVFLSASLCFLIWPIILIGGVIAGVVFGGRYYLRIMKEKVK